MSLVNRDNLINILSNTKDKIENKINRIKVENIPVTVENYTQNTNIPMRFYRPGGAAAVNGIIYLFGGSIDGTKAYKYDPSTNRYTQLASIGYELGQGSCVAVGNNIYLFGGNKQPTYNYMYSISGNSYTNKTVIPYSFKYGSAVSIGTDIYLIGDGYFSNASYPYSRYNYKYDTTTDSYTKMTNIPYHFYWSNAAIMGDYIYLFGSDSSTYRQTAYKYDPSTDTYTKMSNIPYPYHESSIASTGNAIYLLGSYTSGYYYYNYKYINYDGQGIFKPTNHTIYTSSSSYTTSSSSLIKISNSDYYTEYDEDNNIIVNTYPIDKDGNTKMYIKSGAMINGNTVTVDTIGWNTINLLEYV